MRKLGVWGLGVALVVGLGAATARGDDKPGGSWLGRLFGSGDEPEAKKPDPKGAKTDQPLTGSAKTVVKSSAVETATAQRQREVDALLRRLAVCDRLREVAWKTNDQDLLQMAEQLDERARRTYAQRTAHLPAGGVAAESDEQILERHLGPAPCSGTPCSGTVSRPCPGQAGLLPHPDGRRPAAGTTAQEGKP